jgi:hypothetical protein
MGGIVRVGVRVGPVYASARTPKSSGGGGGCAAVLGIIALTGLVTWPLAIGNKPHGGHYLWVWAIAIPWWILCTIGSPGRACSSHQPWQQVLASVDLTLKRQRRGLPHVYANLGEP